MCHKMRGKRLRCKDDELSEEPSWGPWGLYRHLRRCTRDFHVIGMLARFYYIAKPDEVWIEEYKGIEDGKEWMYEVEELNNG